jgi:bifunctional DNA-binding transcriptional regulator/antitoxin component of YhaV-PrlF toxin-antitoxin module
MPYIQENKTRDYWNGEKVGKKSHSRFSITIPRRIVEFMDWKKGDELVFKLDGKRVFLRKTVTE